MNAPHWHKRAKATGRGKTYSFLRLPHYVTDSPEFGALSAKATKLLVELARQFKGNNNGDLSIPWSRLQKRGWKHPQTIQKARDELVETGFVLITRHGGRHVCSLYGITWEPIDECAGKLEVPAQIRAGNDWQKQKVCFTECSDSPGNASPNEAIAA